MKYQIAKRIKRENEQVEHDLYELDASERQHESLTGELLKELHAETAVQAKLEEDRDLIVAANTRLVAEQSAALEALKQKQADELAALVADQAQTVAYRTGLRKLAMSAIEMSVQKRAEIQKKLEERQKAFDAYPAQRKTLEKKLAKLRPDIAKALEICADVDRREAERQQTIAAIEAQRKAVREAKEKALPALKS